MKKYIIFILILILMSFSFSWASAEDTVNSYGYDFMTDFVTNYPARDTGTENELNAALYIADFYQSIGLNPYKTDNSTNQFLVSFEYVNPFNDRRYTSQNVAGIKYGVNTGGKQIIIGAHYDSAYEPIGLNEKYGDGAYDNGSGIGALAQIAYELKDLQLGVDIVFAAFGAEEMGLFGSKFMVDNMSAEEIENTILMINIDSIACGDYLYLYTSEVESSGESYMLNTAREMDIELRDVPEDKKTYPVEDEYSGLLYSHTLLMSDNSSFMKAGIDIALFLGYNLEIPLSLPRESSTYPDIMHTENDTLAKMLELYKGQIQSRINDVSTLVIKYVTDVNIITIMAESKAEKYDYAWLMNKNMIIAVSIIIKILLSGIFILIGYKLIKIEKNIVIVNKNNNNDNQNNIKETYIYEDLKI